MNKSYIWTLYDWKNCKDVYFTISDVQNTKFKYWKNCLNFIWYISFIFLDGFLISFEFLMKFVLQYEFHEKFNPKIQVKCLKIFKLHLEQAYIEFQHYYFFKKHVCMHNLWSLIMKTNKYLTGTGTTTHTLTCLVYHCDLSPQR